VKNWSTRRKTFASAPVLMVNALLKAYNSVLCREKPETNHLRYSTTNSYDLSRFFVINSAHYCKDHTESFNSGSVFQNMKLVYWAASERQTEKRRI
jgi:hypothetical protein